MAHCRNPRLSLRWIACCAALLAGGCFAPRNRPWLAPNEPIVLHPPGDALPPNGAAARADSNDANAGSAMASRLATAKPAPDPRALHDMVAELQAVGAVDPAAQAQLLQDLERTNPSLWPEVMQSFRSRSERPLQIAGQSPETSAPEHAIETLNPTEASALPLTARLTSSTPQPLPPPPSDDTLAAGAAPSAAWPPATSEAPS
ncbi:MAG TPA: hypothetical protein VGJ26_11105, partial [Pirellulales bacterium]